MKLKALVFLLAAGLFLSWPVAQAATTASCCGNAACCNGGSCCK